MSISYQNLDDGTVRRYWSHGRVWLRRSGEWWSRRFGVLGVEWVAPGRCSFGLTFGGGDAGRNLGATISVPWLLTVYLTLEGAFSRRLFDWDADRGEDRDIRLSIDDGAFRWAFWVGSMASWSRRYPWCRWWRQGRFELASLLGKQRYARETLRDGIAVQIPMPEGVYHGTAKIERQWWKRPLGFRRVRVSTWIDVPKGIPFAGKGENSWDCGDDGLHGCGVDGESVERAIGHFVEVVLQNRRRNGQPSPASITRALA